MISKINKGLLFLVYLLVLAYFGFAPLQSIPGRQYPPADAEWDGGAIVIREGAALEVGDAASNLRESLMKTGKMSLEIMLQTDSLEQAGPARIVSFSRSAMGRNFTLGQIGDGLVFRLHTTETDYNGQHRSLLVPMVLKDSDPQHLVITFDGTHSRLYVEGKLNPKALALGGDFSRWGRNHILVLGDEVPGGRPWNGRIHHFAIYDRALNAGEVAMRYEGKPISSAVVACDFQSLENSSTGCFNGLIPLKYRNLFVTTDWDAYNLNDCIANIGGFVPLAGLAYLVFPARIRKKRFIATILLPAVLGLAISGTIELAQRGIVGRVPCLVDLVDNLVGTLLGGLLLWGILTLRSKRI